MEITMATVMTIKPLQLKGTKYIAACVLTLLLGHATLMAQNDFQNWNSIDINYKFIPKTVAWAAAEIRLNENATNLKKANFDIGIDRKLFSFSEITLAYRYSRFDDTEAYKNDHLIYGCWQFGFKAGRFSLSYQTRYQRTYEVNGLSTLLGWQDIWRNKCSIGYNIYQSPLSPYINYELFTIANTGNGLENDKYRLFAGLKYKLNKRNTISSYYGIQNSLAKPGKDFILGLKYSISLERKDKETSDE